MQGLFPFPLQRPRSSALSASGPCRFSSCLSIPSASPDLDPPVPAASHRGRRGRWGPRGCPGRCPGARPSRPRPRSRLQRASVGPVRRRKRPPSRWRRTRRPGRGRRRRRRRPSGPGPAAGRPRAGDPSGPPARLPRPRHGGPTRRMRVWLGRHPRPCPSAGAQTHRPGLKTSPIGDPARRPL